MDSLRKLIPVSQRICRNGFYCLEKSRGIIWQMGMPVSMTMDR